MLRARWNDGERDLETGLRLMFLAWYACAEPFGLTGLDPDDDCISVFSDVFNYFGGSASREPELLYAVGLMAWKHSFPWCCGGDVGAWESIADACMKRAKELKPGGFPSKHFDETTAYGQYFAWMTEVRNQRLVDD